MTLVPRGASARYDVGDQNDFRAAAADEVNTLINRLNAEHISGDRGDTDVTLNAGTDFQVQRFATNLTSNRTITLGTGYPGAKFTIVRATPSAANSIDVGGLKTLAGTNLWCDVGHDGSAWYLLRAGSL